MSLPGHITIRAVKPRARARASANYGGLSIWGHAPPENFGILDSHGWILEPSEPIVLL